MSSKMLYEAIALIRSAKLDEARRIIFELIRTEPTNEMAWMWLAETLSSDSDRMKVLKSCQLENPNSRITNMAIQKLQEKIDLEAAQVPSVSPFKDGATFDPNLPDRTGHTGAIIGFDGSFIVSEVSDFDDVIDLRKNEDEVSPFKEESEPEVELDSTQVFLGGLEEKSETFGFEETNEDIQPAELEFEPDLSGLFQDEEIGVKEENAFLFDDEGDYDQVSSLEKENELEHLFSQTLFSDDEELKEEELTAFDLGFMEDAPTLINSPVDLTEEDTDKIRSLLQEDDLVEDRVIKSGVEEFEQRRKKKDRNLVILVSGLFILIAVLCVVAVYVVLNYSKFAGQTPIATATQQMVIVPEEIATATLAPTPTNTLAPTATPTTIPTPTPLVALSDLIINPENSGLLQVKLTRVFENKAVTSLAGNYVAFADDEVVTIMNPVDGSQLFELSEHTSTVTDMVFSTDENYLVSAADDFSIYLWNLNSGTLDKRFVFDGNAITRVFGGSGNNFPRIVTVDYSPDGSTIAAGTFGLISIFDIPTGLSRGQYAIEPIELQRIVAEAQEPVGFDVKFNENGWVLAAAMSGKLVGVDSLDATPLYQFDLSPVAVVTFADDRLDMIEADTGGVSLRRLDTGEVYNGFGGKEGKPNEAAPLYSLSENWDMIGIETDAGEGDVQLTIWDINQDQKIIDFAAVCENDNCRTPAFAFSPNGDWIVVETNVDGITYAKVIQLETLSEIHQFDKFSSPIQSICVSPNADLITILNQNGVLRIWDFKFGAQRNSLDASGFTNIEFSKNGQFLFGRNPEEFVVWSTP
jgi:WD40 repeat protein